MSGDIYASDLGVTSFSLSDRYDKLVDLDDSGAPLNLLIGKEEIGKGLLSSDLRKTVDYYYTLLENADGLPRRSAFNPAALPQHLPNMFLVEVVPAPDGSPDYRYRVFGTGLALLFGAEMTGKLVSEYPGANRAQRSRHILDRALAAKCPIRTAGEFLSKNGLPVFGESIVLPFGEGDKVTHLLADLDYDSQD